MKFVAAGVVVLIIAILAARTLHMNLLGAMLIVVFGFLFVTVSSRLTGEIGSSSNPISGMTVATLLLTCLIFLIVGWTGGTYYVTALSVGGIVCIAASNGGTTSQDLKTGFLLGATPKYQQIAILIGAAASALVLGPILLGLNNAATVYVPAAQVAPGLHAPADVEAGADRETLPARKPKTTRATFKVWHKTDDVGGPAGKYLVDDSGAAVWLVIRASTAPTQTRPDGTEVRKFDAPKAMLMSYIIKGILDRKLPWALVLFGVMIAVVLELCGVSSLAFAVGVYLPISSFGAGVRRRIGALAGGSPDAPQSARAQSRRSTNSRPKATRAPACCWPAATSPAARLRASSSHFSPARCRRLDTRIAKWAETGESILRRTER